MFASVSCECCKSRSKCCDIVTISDTCYMCINLDVTKVDLEVSLLHCRRRVSMLQTHVVGCYKH
jgi:hypothetical protein